MAAVYLPPNEMLSWYEGFAAAYRSRESAIDETYYHLALLLEPLPLKGEKRHKAQTLVHELFEASGIRKIGLERGRFVIELSDKETYQAQLAAQGLNKIAQIIYLIII